MAKLQKDRKEQEYYIYDKPFRNLYETLSNSAKRFPDKIAIYDDEGEITYLHLQHRVDQMAYFLQKQLSIKEGSRIGLMFVNSIQFCIAFYATVKIGCIAVMVNTKLQNDEIKFVLGDTKTETLIMNAAWIDKVKSNIYSLGIKNIIFDKSVSLDGITIPTYDFDHISEFESKTNFEVSMPKDPWQTAAIMHTSGTTGNPKGVMIAHRNILETAYGYEEVLGLDESARTVLAVPIFHILGLSCVTTFFIYLGATIVLSAIYNTENVLNKITRYKATHFHCVPTVFIKLTKAYQPIYDFSSLKIAVCGGAPITKENVDKFCELAPNASFRLAYGMTETAGGGVLSPGHRLPGKPTPNVAITIADGDMLPVPTGTAGQVIFKGPNVIRKYWNGQEFENGHLPSGDIGRMDEDGYIYVVDRVKDLINRGGEKIFPSVIEKTLLNYPGILQSAVFAVSDELYGEIPAAVIIAENGAKLNIDSIRSYLKEKIAKYEIPQRIEIWDSLPATDNGKIRKAELRKQFEASNEML